ncbi:hypothetical protein FHX37_3046 [Haloactinospora alba]|uniref:DUF4190 domain-containing protein n=1 Tax=Haloactinospora alba TaxID=405555 RepID=A0A543NMJ4_9ACTN|nr:hypothetical protein [Haloactinospora alba]TQN33052.1 hypothetical protein FHX37_3046 [Haloactinospora alba]
MTDNGGERHVSPHDEYEPSQQEQGSWFTPSGDRHRSQSQYQDSYEAGVDGAPATEATPAAGDEPYETGATGGFHAGFPDTGGYPGMSGTRPGMAEPYPSALDGLGTAPSGPGAGADSGGEQPGASPSAPYAGFPSPAVSRPYTPPADPATGEIPTVSHDVGAAPGGQEDPSASGPGAGYETAPPLGGDATPPAESGGAESVYRVPEPEPQQSAPFGGSARSGEWYSDPLSPVSEGRAAGDPSSHPGPSDHTGGERSPEGDPPGGGWGGEYTVPPTQAPRTYPTGQWYDTSAAGPPEDLSHGGGSGYDAGYGWGAAPAQPWATSHGDHRSTASSQGFPTGENTSSGWAGPVNDAARSADGYDDELSRPSYPGAFAEDDQAAARWEQWSGSAAGEESAAGPHTGAGTSGVDPGGQLGTGSGNTWAFSREDPQLPDSVRQAGIRAEERRGAAPDAPAGHETGGWSAEGGTTGFDSGFAAGTAPAEGAVPQDGGADPLADGHGRAGGPQAPSYDADPLGSGGWYDIGASAGAGTDTWYGAGTGQPPEPEPDSGTASDSGTGTQAMPAVPQDEGTDPLAGGGPPEDARSGAWPRPYPEDVAYGPAGARSGPPEEEWNGGAFRETPPPEGEAGAGEQEPSVEPSRSAPIPEGEFPDFDERSADAAADVDPYPGYDNIDYWPETDPGALSTVWLGVLSLVPVIGVASAAVVLLLTAPKARTSIAESGGELEGVKLVTAGVAMAWAGIALFVVEVVAVLGVLLTG